MTPEPPERVEDERFASAEEALARAPERVRVEGSGLVTHEYFLHVLKAVVAERNAALHRAEEAEGERATDQAIAESWREQYAAMKAHAAKLEAAIREHQEDFVNAHLLDASVGTTVVFSDRDARLYAALPDQLEGSE